MKRNTIAFTTPGGREVVLKEYLTYAEVEAALKIDDKIEQNRLLMDAVIVSVDGVTENPHGYARANLPIAEYTSITERLKGVIEGNFPKAK